MSESISHIFNFYQIADNLASSGQPEADDFELIKQAGFDTVINLATCDSPKAISNEQEVVEGCGLNYKNIPINFAVPELHNLQNFFQIMEEQKDNTVYVHCAYNWRASVFIYLYRVLRLHEDDCKAKNDLMSMWHPDSTWREFIDQAMEHYQKT